VKFAKPVWWITIIPALLLTYTLAFINPFFIGHLPYFILHYASFGFITLSNYEAAVQIIALLALALHLGETFYGYKLLSKHHVRDSDGTWWVVLIFLLGIPQINVMKQRLLKKKLGPPVASKDQ